MRRIAIIEPVVCAGGVERFVHGLIRGAIESGVADEWEVVLVRNRVNTANIHVPWPDYLMSRGVRVVYPPQNTLGRILDKLSLSHRLLGIPGTGLIQRRVARALRYTGPASWRIYSGNIESWVESYIRSHPFDVVYCPYPDLVEPPYTRQPIVITLHDFVFKYGGNSGSARQQARDQLVRQWMQVSSKIVHSSQFIAEEMKRFYPSFAHKSQVIRLGIPSSRRLPSNGEVIDYRRRVGLPERFVMVVGSMMQHKNQHVVFEAIAHLRDRGMHVPLVCVGPNAKELNLDRRTANAPALAPRYTTKIINICHAAGLKNGVDYLPLGFVDDFELECLYRSAAMVIVPSITEAGSFPGVEAMRAGCPVVFSKIPPFLELMNLVEGNAWSFQVDDSNELADRIQHILGDGTEVRARAREAMRLVPQLFCWKRTAQDYFSLFAQAAEPPARNELGSDAGIGPSRVSSVVNR